MKRYATVSLVSIVLIAAIFACVGIAGATTQPQSIVSEFENKLIPDALGGGQLLMPADVVAIGDMIAVTDAGTSRLNIFDMNGTFIARYGSEGDTLVGEIEMPAGLTTDGEKLYLAANPEVVSVWNVSDDGTTASPLLAVPADETEIGSQQVAVDADGSIYIVGGPTHHNMALPCRILKYDSAGLLLAEANASTFTAPAGLDVSGTHLFVSETDPMGEAKILVYNAADMTLAGVELAIPANSAPGDVDIVGTNLYVSVTSFTGGVNGVVMYDVSSLDPAPECCVVADTSALLGVGMMVTGIDVDADGNIYVATSAMTYSSSGQVIVYDSTGNQTLSFPDQIELLSIWGMDHDESGKVYMLPVSFGGSPVSIRTANIDGTEFAELTNLNNTGGSFLKLDDAGHIWYSQLGFAMPNWDMASSGVYSLDMNGSELCNLVTYNTSLTVDPTTGENITDGERSFQVPTGIFTETEDDKHYLYVAESKVAGMLGGGSGMITKFEYEFEPEWQFTEVWTAGTFIAAEPTRDLVADPPTAGELSIPFGMALHPDGDVLYVVDENYWRVIMLSPDDGSWLGEFVEAPLLPAGCTRYSEALAHVMAHDPSCEEAVLMPLDVDVDTDSGLVYVSYHGGHGANVYTKAGDFVGHVGVADIDSGGIVAGLNLDIVPTGVIDRKHIILGDGHGWSVAVYGVTTLKDPWEDFDPNHLPTHIIDISGKYTCTNEAFYADPGGALSSEFGLPYQEEGGNWTFEQHGSLLIVTVEEDGEEMSGIIGSTAGGNIMLSFAGCWDVPVMGLMRFETIWTGDVLYCGDKIVMNAIMRGYDDDCNLVSNWAGTQVLSRVET